ncbi:MAG: alpha-galactosidase [Thermoguttaceae bacterium]|nr:alpha-galactosidase [Thermoguttaceae bacterium]
MNAIALAAVQVFTLLLGPWSVTFEEENSRLRLEDPVENVCIEGTLSFESNGQAWKIVRPRDAVGNRLGLLSPTNDIQGYLTFQQNGNRLEMLVSHRTRQFYSGVLKFDGKIRFRDFSFACKTQACTKERVLFLAAGNGNSLKNDTLFAPEEDLAVQFRSASLQLTSETAGEWNVAMSGRIEESAEAVFGFNVEKNYLQSRYIPYYSPIDRKRAPKAPTGWMSWNIYFDTATAEDNLAEARIGKKYLQPFGMEFWHIESWQGNSDKLPVSNFYNLNLEVNERQFPKGMKQLADDIRALGFRPGIWTAPFGTGSDEFYAQHKTWFLHDVNGNPMRTWNGKYTIDPSNDEVVAHLRRIHEIMAKDWGYEYFKIDGMSGAGAGYCAHFFERPEVKAAMKDPNCPDPFERCVRAFREGIGEDRVFNACQGHFTGPEPKYADCGRIGADIVHPNKPVGWENLLNQAGRTHNQIFAHNIVFYADPDTLMVNDALTLEEARLSTVVVSLPGQMMFSGDKLAELPMERMRLLQQALPPVADIHPVNLYPIFHLLPVWDLKVRRDWGAYDVIALFNWEDEEAEVGFDFAEVGLDPHQDCVMYEFWTEHYVGKVNGGFSCKIPPHAVRLFAVHRAQDHPQFLSSDRHITQGAVDVKSVSWQEGKLTAKLELVGGFPTTFRFTVPEGMRVKSVSAGDSVSVETRSEADGRVLAVKLGTETSQTVELSADFQSIP